MMKFHLLSLSALIAGVALADPLPPPPVKPDAAKPNQPAKQNAAGTMVIGGGGNNGGANVVTKTRMFVNGVEVDPAEAGGVGGIGGFGGMIQAIPVNPAAGQLILNGGGAINIGAIDGDMMMGMAGVGDDENGFEPGEMGMDPHTAAIIRKNQMLHLKNNPQMPQEVRRQLLKESIKMGMPKAVPPPPADYLPQYEMDDYAKYVGYDKDQDGFLNEQEAAAYAGALRTEEAEKAAWYGKAMLATYDTNKDGKLDDAEKKEYQEFTKLVQDIHKETAQKQAEFVKEYDLNKDGKLDGQEYGQALKQEEIKRLRAQLLRLRPVLDLNKDSKLDDAEFAAFEKEMLPKYDQDKDGKLDKKEIRRVIGALSMEQFRDMQQRMQEDQKADQKIKEKRYDIDGDGKLNAVERKRMQEDQKTGVQVPPQDE